MRRPHTRETIERCRVLVETTVRANEDIAGETGTSDATVRRWTRVFGWKRPAGAEPDRRKIPLDKYDATRRIYACGASSADIAQLARCSASHVEKIAAREGWTRGHPAEAAPPANRALNEALAAIEAALREPHVERKAFLRLIDRAMALAAADALKGVPGVERAARILTLLAASAKTLPDEAPEAHVEDKDIIEEFAHRLQELYGDAPEPAHARGLGEDGPYPSCVSSNSLSLSIGRR